MNKETHGPWPSGHHEQGEAIGALTSLPHSLPLCILKTQRPLRCPWTNTPELCASSTFLKTEMRVPKNVSVIPVLDSFNMPITLRPRGRESPGAAEDSARGHKNHSYTKVQSNGSTLSQTHIRGSVPSPLCHNIRFQSGL